MAPNGCAGFVQQFMIFFHYNLPTTSSTTTKPKPKQRLRMWVKPWILERDDKETHNTLMTDLCNT